MITFRDPDRTDRFLAGFRGALRPALADGDSGRLDAITVEGILDQMLKSQTLGVIAWDHGGDSVRVRAGNAAVGREIPVLWKDHRDRERGLR